MKTTIPENPGRFLAVDVAGEPLLEQIFAQLGAPTFAHAKAATELLSRVVDLPAEEIVPAVKELSLMTLNHRDTSVSVEMAKAVATAALAEATRPHQNYTERVEAALTLLSNRFQGDW